MDAPKMVAGVEDEVVALASPGFGDGESEIGSFGHEGGFAKFACVIPFVRFCGNYRSLAALGISARGSDDS